MEQVVPESQQSLYEREIVGSFTYKSKTMVALCGNISLLIKAICNEADVVTL
jgi:hypothetical protein